MKYPWFLSNNSQDVVRQNDTYFIALNLFLVFRKKENIFFRKIYNSMKEISMSE